MIRKVYIALALVVGVSACGVDGEPIQPSLNTYVGVSSSGVDVHGGVNVGRGPLNVYVGF